MTTTPNANALPNYQLGDSLGKGAFGQVYRALNWTTGETVAVKQIQLSNIPKGELGEIMSEIDLLKNLNHANIVKYKGYVKTRENLYIILEYCENGSLHNICKRFGKFPENLVGVYIAQVLEGLVYLHDQGVIHRDIKGANILTNKDGTVKLADFGVATTPAGGITDGAVVGSPYWMAPEVIEQTGATTASDIWSVGCVVIELLEGKPPYHFLAPMPALFRIVQDDCPPIPEGASPVVKDFLYHCFQKDCNLRISAKKLLKHPWMVGTRRQLGLETKKGAGERPSSHYEEAVQQVQEWNEALKCECCRLPWVGISRPCTHKLQLATAKRTDRHHAQIRETLDSAHPPPHRLMLSGSPEESRQCPWVTVNNLIEQLTPSSPDYVMRDACDGMLAILEDAPEMQYQLVSSHGLLAIVDVLEANPSREVIMKLLRIVNLLVTTDLSFLESFCLIGYLTSIIAFTTKKYSSECRLEASHFIRLLCHSSVLTLQMFISCRGLRVLVDLLDEDFAEQTDLVVHALNGIGSVFELQGPTPKNDFCRMFIREGLLDPLSSALLNVMASRGESTSDMKHKIIQILVIFCQVSQSDTHVRTSLGTRKIIRRLLRACELLEPEHLVVMLRAIKHLSMNGPLLDVLQNANCIEILVRILEEQSQGPHSTEIANHIFQTCFNLCRLNKSRQEEAAQAGIIPLLKRVIETGSPLKQFALPILCDLASAGKSCRTLLWQHDVLNLYVRLLTDQYFQVTALESINVWLQDETARVEDQLTRPENNVCILGCFISTKTNSFEHLLDPFLKLFRLSNDVAMSVAKPEFFNRIIDRLRQTNKAMVKLNMLRVLRAVCDAHPDSALLVEKFGVMPVVERLSQKDASVLVRELAREIIPSLTGTGARATRSPTIPVSAGPIPKGFPATERRRVRRTASETSFATLGLGLSTSSTPSNSPSGPRPGLAPRLPSARQRVPLRSKLPSISWQSPE
ncbi:hypothetical protein M407DRAFT_214002 [Tulasnella calospora MUT 4182]|uniref:non-specific serine/threonine protein kinase n=1 Tax=Tulasnella calospora MUT 4182 TaxID=1051891 RepID=A0A0C3QDX8_9AGAM|nr:hypothetical protein M407DRAFT_214002 [Tulasnella calospora MUT 4182]